MQPSYFVPSSTLAGAAAFAGEEEKDAHHQADVEAACGCFYALIVEMFGFWTLASLATLALYKSIYEEASSSIIGDKNLELLILGKNSK